MDLYLITGFLGAGKTTFLRQFLPQFAGKRLWLIINEYGKAGVDGALLKEYDAVLKEITNGSIFCACRLDRFEEELSRAVESRPDIILVEASGLSDPTSVRRVLDQPAFAPITYKGSVCLVDTPRLERVIHTARVCPKQLMVSSLVLLNKTDLAGPGQLEAARRAVAELNPHAVLQETRFGEFDPSWMADIRPLGGDEPPSRPDIRLQKQLVRISPAMTLPQLTHFLRMVAEDTWRIKGVAVLEGQRLLVDCVGPSVTVTPGAPPSENENQLVLLAGPGMALRKGLKEAVRWYPQLVEEVDEP